MTNLGGVLFKNGNLIMAALCNRAGHYIFALWFLFSIFLFFYFSIFLLFYFSIFLFFYFSIFLLFFSPNLSRLRLDVCHTSTRGVALVRI